MAATLLNTNFLCSDFNLKNLIGVSENLEEHLIITCKGFVKVYNAHDQKLIQSWTTKTWHPFTAPAVCDPESKKIIAVINHSSISRWNHTDDDIDKVKKENFGTSIHQLIVSGGVVYVVFSTGQIEDLESALKTRKEVKPGCVGENETITYAAIEIEENIAVLVVKDQENHVKVWQLNLSGGSLPVCCNMVVKDERLTGVCMLSAKLYTLWSNGIMYCHNLHSDAIERLPGRQYSTVTLIDSSRTARMLPVSSSHFAVIGADVKDEGSMLLLWDAKFAMVTSKRRLKMYYDPPYAWVSSVGIIFVDGGSLSCTPYVITDSTLATVFGSRVSADVDCPPEACYGWDATADVKKGETETIYTNKSEKLVEIVRSVDKISLSESVLVGTILGPLVENRDLLLLHEVITVFEDIPESCLVKVIQCYIRCKDSEFDGLFKYPAMPMEVECAGEEGVVRCPFGPGKAAFVNTILKKPYTDSHLAKEFTMLSFEDTLCLIRHLYFLIVAGEVLICPGEDDLSLGEVSEWLSLLLDTKYHQLILSSEVDVHRLLLSCFSRISNMHKLLQELIALEPLIERIADDSYTSQGAFCSGYSLEKLVITR
ncbi:nucleolar protein 11 isoform X2 [Palaemon carinicauda]|uniref:nucleolar protein 11 isoform X2 n=1 Tax=Palaemon carinicauda TaxID=392227 RepID=UPI0035B5E912